MRAGGERPFGIELRLDPAPTDLAALRRWPSTDLRSDYLVATAGHARLTFGGVPVVYAGQRFVALDAGEPLPPGATDLLTDYVGGFAQRLAEALVDLPPSGRRFVAFVDSPAGLRLTTAANRATVAYREWPSGPDLASARLPVAELRGICLASLERFLGSLLELNPSLIPHPDVALLKRTVDRLGAKPGRAGKKSDD